MAIQHDFEFIKSIAAEFFKRSHIKKTLKQIDECAMTGWEKWLQIEVAAFLQDHKNVKAWWRESSYSLDTRLVASRRTCAVDFLIHERAKHSHMAVELKQINSPTACVKGMLKDKKKIQSIKSVKYDIRSVWCIGVHKDVHAAEVSRLVTYYSDVAGVQINKKFLCTEKIGHSAYNYTIF
jgi:hypothetical protein